MSIISDKSYTKEPLLKYLNTDFLRYNVESPVQDPTTLHIREVRISTRANNNYTLEMSDGRAIIREGEDIRIMDRDGNEEYNSATEPAEDAVPNLARSAGRRAV